MNTIQPEIELLAAMIEDKRKRWIAGRQFNNESAISSIKYEMKCDIIASNLPGQLSVEDVLTEWDRQYLVGYRVSGGKVHEPR